MSSKKKINRQTVVDKHDIEYNVLKPNFYSYSPSNKLAKSKSEKIIKRILANELDVTIVLEDGEIKTSCKLLTQRSDYFSTMFNGNFKESSSKEVKIPCRKVIMEKVLDYLFIDCLDISDMSLEDKMEMRIICDMILVPDQDKLEEILFLNPIKKMKIVKDTHDLFFSERKKVIESLNSAAKILDVTLKMSLDVSKKIVNHLSGFLSLYLTKLETKKVTLSNSVVLALIKSGADGIDKLKLFLMFKDTTFANKEIPDLNLIEELDLEGEVNPSELFDEGTLLETIIKKQRRILNGGCYCEDCSCCDYF